MLFLAVSLGFLAENIREEQIIAHQGERVLFQLHQELKQDTAMLNGLRKNNEQLDSVTAFITYFIKKDQLEQNKQSFYLLHDLILYRHGIFESSCIALEQLKYTGLLKNITHEKLRSNIEQYTLWLKAMEERNTRLNNFMDKYADDLRLVPFDVYKSYSPAIEYLNTEKGKTISGSDVYCNNSKIHLQFSQTFLPDHIIIKPFDKQKYLNTILELSAIRNGTQEDYFKFAFEAGTELLKSIEEEYPEIGKQ